MKTEFDRKAKIAAQCWMLTREVETWAEIIKYGDIGFPLAYAHTAGLVEVNKKGAVPVLEVYDIIVESLDIDPDKEYEDFEAMLDQRIEDQDADEENTEESDK